MIDLPPGRFSAAPPWIWAAHVAAVAFVFMALAIGHPAAAKKSSSPRVNHVRDARDAAEEGRYDAAVAAIRRALRDKPESRRLERLLDEYSLAAALMHAELAESWLTRGDIDRAVDEVGIGLDYYSSAEEVWSVRESVDSMADQVDESIEQAVSEAREGDHDAGLARLSELDLEWDYGRLDDAIETVRELAASRAIADAENALRVHDFDAVPALVELARQYGVDATAVREQYQEAMDLLDDIDRPPRDALVAFERFGKAVARDAGFPGLRDAYFDSRVGVVSELRLNTHLMSLEPLLLASPLETRVEAIWGTISSVDTSTIDPDLPADVRRFREQLAQIYEVRGMASLGSSVDGRPTAPTVALIFFRKALAADPTRSYLRSYCDDLQRHADAVMKRDVVVTASGSPAHTDIADGLAARGRDAVRGLGYPGVRAHLSSNTDECVDAGNGRYCVMIGISGAEVGESRPRGRSSIPSIYLSGTHQERNLRYDQVVSQLDYARRELRRVEAEYDAAERELNQSTSSTEAGIRGAGLIALGVAVGTWRGNVANLERQLAATPQMITVEDFSRYEAETYTVEKDGRIQGRLTFRDNRIGAFRDRSVAGSASYEDRVVTGVHRNDTRGVREDPLQLPTDSRVLEDARSNLYSNGKREITRLVQDALAKEIVRARELERRGEMLESLEIRLEVLRAAPRASVTEDVALQMKRLLGFDVVSMQVVAPVFP